MLHEVRLKACTRTALLMRVIAHQLTHNVHGPHDDKFYKHLAGLQEEYDALQRSGYAGEGFFTPGQRLGVGMSHNVPIHVARSKALEAAEKRMKMSQVLGGGGRLGETNRNLDPRELAARVSTGHKLSLIELTSI
jgi:DNA-dependent metalloprotease WSS1